MSIENPFVLEDDFYQRDLDFAKHWMEQNALALHKLRGISMDEAREFIKETVKPTGKRPFKDVGLNYLKRDQKTLDRAPARMGLYRYLKEAIDEGDIIAPTLTRYVHPSIKESPLVDSIDNNVAHRAINKKAYFAAQMAGDMNLAIAKDGEQTNNKLSNNALSGAHVSASTILHNKTAHSSLTSTCRITSGYGNANNEKLISGNRHYHSVDVTYNNITSIVYLTDLDAVRTIMDKYKLHYPTPKEVYDVIMDKASRYWRNKEGAAFIKEYLDKLEPVELAAILYVGDLWHIKEYNDAFMRTFIGDLIKRGEVEHPEAETIIKNADDDFKSLANQLQGNEMLGVDINRAKGQPVYGKVASTIKNVEEALLKYADFIRVFFCTKNVPASLSYFPHSLRDTVLASDTDSTIFTVQEWVKWYKGDYVMDELGNSIFAIMTFIASQNIVHILMLMSANIGVERKRLKQIAMKNEYRFDGFGVTNRTKHYYALIGCQEGNVFKEYSQEIKGVGLKSSAVPKDIMEAAADFMRKIIADTIEGKSISMIEIINKIIETEDNIYNKVKSNSSEYFTFQQIKSADSYKLAPHQSPYQHYTMWKEVFAPKYGETQPPPYTALKVNADINTPREFQTWLDGIEDRALARRFEAWCEKNGKRDVKTFYLPLDIVSAKGVPDEIFPLIDIRRIMLDNMSVFYAVLETLNISVVDKNITTLISDFAKGAIAVPNNGL